MADRVAALLAHMAATVAMVDGMISKAKGEEPKQEPKAPASLGSGSRSYRVSDWMPTCKGCPRNGRCGEDKRECGNAKWFPIVHFVSMAYRDGVVVRTSCCDGRKAGGPPCSSPKCKHIDRALAVVGGKPDRGVELVLMSGVGETMPKCPSCRERWSVSRVDDHFECRSPVCVRDGVPWRFAEGDTGKPSPMRHKLVIMDREPGKVVVKRQG